VIPLVFPKFCFQLADVPTTRKVFTVSTSPHGSILPFRTVCISEHGMGDPVLETDGVGPQKSFGANPGKYAASANTLP
jgi:hypothetical protein